MSTTTEKVSILEMESYLETPAPALSKRFKFAHSLHYDAPLERSVQASVMNQPAAETVDCLAAPDQGSCGDYRLVWHFSSEFNTCRQFYYGGCAGNTNRFESRVECEKMCSSEERIEERVEIASEASRTLEEVGIVDTKGDAEFANQEIGHILDDMNALPELCMLPEQRGSCFDNILRWRFNSEKSECVSFMYSGCDANANHFTSQEHCERACGKWRAQNVCEQPKNVGECHLAIPRWYFEVDQCRLMMWSGCGGNGNSFSSKSDCESLCRAEITWSAEKPTCSLPRSSGPCTDSISMWYFDTESTECKQFTYGGCRGNANRFVSRQQCEQKCRGSVDMVSTTEKEMVCRLAFETGPCGLDMQKYFYDPYTQTCQLFYYGGCEGNENRFDSEFECMNQCRGIKMDPSEKIQQLSSSTSPTIYVINKGTIFTGSTFRVRCNSHGQIPVTWFKNGDILQFGSRITEENDDTLEFVDALTSDSGLYSCLAGADSEMSNAVEVAVRRASTTTTTTTTTTTITPTTNVSHRKPCIDTGNAGTCSLIVKNGLCTKKRYGSFCCRTCTAKKFKF